MQRRRIPLLAIAISVLFLVVGVRLTWLQGFEWRLHHERAETRRKSIQFLPAMRGRILDRNGRVLAEDVPLHELVYTLRGVDPAPLVAKRLAGLLRGRQGDQQFPYDEEKLKDEVRVLRQNCRRWLARGQPMEPHPWVSGLPPETVARVQVEIERRPHHYPGIDTRVQNGVGEIVVSPEVLFAGELGVRLAARRTGVDPEPLVQRIARAYQATLARPMNRVQREYEFASRERVLLPEIPFSLVVEVCYHPDRFPGLRVREGSRRRYPAGESVAQLVGYTGRLTARKLEALVKAESIIDRAHGKTIDDIRSFLAIRSSSYLSEDSFGRAGLERDLEVELRGLVGARIVEIDGRGRRHGAPLAEEPPTAGHDVTLNLDAELCRVARDILVARGVVAGSVIVGDPSTGEIFGWTSHPSFHPERLGAQWHELEKIKHLSPLWDRPHRFDVPPGSTFKLVLALGALADGLVRRDDLVLCEGRYDAERHPHQFKCANHRLPLEVDVVDALARSCNVYFYRLGADVMKIEGIRTWARRLGFGTPTGIDIARERAGVLPRTSPQSAGIGQGFTATPIQVFRLVCGIANRGRFPVPRLRRDTPVSAETVAIPAGIWDTVIAGMVGAVEYGTASSPSIGLRPFDCAVKTGTAETGKKSRTDDDIAWIVGFAPVHTPRIAFVVEIEETGLHGGDVAGPVVAELLTWLERHRDYDLHREP